MLVVVRPIPIGEATRREPNVVPAQVTRSSNRVQRASARRSGSWNCAWAVKDSARSWAEGRSSSRLAACDRLGCLRQPLERASRRDHDQEQPVISGHRLLGWPGRNPLSRRHVTHAEPTTRRSQLRRTLRTALTTGAVLAVLTGGTALGAPPPTFPHIVTAQPDTDSVVLTDYLTTAPVTVQVLRGGVLIATSQSVTPVSAGPNKIGRAHV